MVITINKRKNILYIILFCKLKLWFYDKSFIIMYNKYLIGQILLFNNHVSK